MVRFVERRSLYYSAKTVWIIVDSSKFTKGPGKYIFRNNFQLLQLR